MRRWKQARVYTATFTFTTLGGLLGLALGLAGGLARRSVAASSLAAASGLVLGSVAAGVSSLALVSYFYKTFDPNSGDLLLPLLTHSCNLVDRRGRRRSCVWTGNWRPRPLDRDLGRRSRRRGGRDDYL